MASSKIPIDRFQPAAKRLKSLPPSETLLPKVTISRCKSSLSSSSGSSGDLILTIDQKSRVKVNKFHAISKRNLRICTERVEKAKANGLDYVRLEELLAVESWLGALLGELQKPYTKNLCKFVERGVRGSVPIYPSQSLIFNAINSASFERVKAVILG